MYGESPLEIREIFCIDLEDLHERRFSSEIFEKKFHERSFSSGFESNI